MRRREFIALVAGTTAWPLIARAQHPVRTIGFLSSRSPGDSSHIVAAFHQGLKEAGYVEGENVTIHYRWAEGDYQRLPALAADLVNRKVDLIVATGGQASALAAKAATSTIPIVFTSGDDPVKLGLVASLARPGGNITGVNVMLSEHEGKRLGLLHELVQPPMIAVLLNPSYPDSHTQLADVEGAARTLNQQIHIVNASSRGEIDTAFVALGQLRAGALLVCADAFFGGQREQLVALAAQYAIPAIYGSRDYVIAGGLMSYGSRFTEALQLVGVYAGRILNGEKPSSLPIQQPTKLELVLNLRTAKSLGFTIPPSLLARADEIFE